MKKINFLVVLAFLFFACSSDDDTIATCEVATNVTSTSITTTSATISWNDSNNAPSYSIEFGLSGFNLGAGNMVDVMDATIALNGLTANTTYDVYITALCSTSNVSMVSEVFSFTSLPNPIIPQFLTNLSELNLFNGPLSDLTPSIYAFEYELSSVLFTDYAHKQRLIALPSGGSLTFDGDGLPIFPSNSLIAKTFYYNIDETDLSRGKTIIETRILIKVDDHWESGNYKWNESQTEATFDMDGGDLPVIWIDANGITNNIIYSIPPNADCLSCHQENLNLTPIGPKMRTLNFEVNGANQLQSLIDQSLLTGLTDPNTVGSLPDYSDDTNYTLEERARAYFDINCAHCHSEGGLCEVQSILRLNFETSLNDSNIVDRKNSIISRVSTYNAGISMPFIGTTILHDEGVTLIQEYLNTL